LKIFNIYMNNYNIEQINELILKEQVRKKEYQGKNDILQTKISNNQIYNITQAEYDIELNKMEIYNCNKSIENFEKIKLNIINSIKKNNE